MEPIGFGAEFTLFRLSGPDPELPVNTGCTKTQ